ncbi:circularly permuted type 2 ATP-grasp protein [Klebsiella pneumoniae]|nr:circularly permuted type 2 ATP-grasp protein [Klebsiella pneumoniae]
MTSIMRAEYPARGLIPAEQVLANEQYQPCMQGINLPNTICSYHRRRYGAHNDGQYYVPEDLRTPSGVSYMLETVR